MLRGKLLSFSPGGEKLAQGGEDGVLRIWDTTTGLLEQEYQPPQHLAQPPTCIQFSPPKKYRKLAVQRSGYRSSLVVMGTKGGTILVYSPEKKEVVATMTHSAPHDIVDVAWYTSTRFFSLSADSTLVEWDVNTQARIITNDVSHEASITSMCALNGKNVCLGSSWIQQVQLEKKLCKVKKKKVFVGHASNVTQMIPVFPEGKTKYLLSTATDDKFIYAWNLSGESGEPCASFKVKGMVSSLAVLAEEKTSTVTLAVTTHQGNLGLYTQHLNGSLQGKAVTKSGTLSIQTGDCNKTKTSRKTIIPILCSFFLHDTSNSIIIVYGDSTFLKFERMSVSEISGNKELVRTYEKGIVKKMSTVGKVVTPKVTKDVKVLGPGHLTITPAGTTKRKLGEDGKCLLPMEERLNALAIDKSTVNTNTTSKPLHKDNQVHLLLQGLHSQDMRLLQPVLSCKDPEVISNTVRRLPTQAIAPLLTLLQQVIIGKGHKQIEYVQWVRSVLYHHMSHLSILPEREGLVSPFYSVATAKMASLVQMTQLHARLDLLLTHVATRHQVAGDHQDQPQPLLHYQEEPSSDEDLPEGALGVSESEDNWEELSDLEDMNGESDESDMEVDQAHTTTTKRKNTNTHLQDNHSQNQAQNTHNHHHQDTDHEEGSGHDDDDDNDDDDNDNDDNDDEEEEEEENENAIAEDSEILLSD